MRRAVNLPFPIRPSLLLLSVAVLLLGGPTVPDASFTLQQRESEITPNGLPVARTCYSSAPEQSQPAGGRGCELYFGLKSTCR